MDKSKFIRAKDFITNLHDCKLHNIIKLIITYYTSNINDVCLFYQAIFFNKFPFTFNIYAIADIKINFEGWEESVIYLEVYLIIL